MRSGRQRKCVNGGLWEGRTVGDIFLVVMWAVLLSTVIRLKTLDVGATMILIGTLWHFCCF